MTRPLLITAVCSFVAAVVCFSLAWTLGGFSWERWRFDNRDWFFDAPRHYDGPPVDGGGPDVTRTLDWTGDDELTVAAPADVVYVQGPAGKIVIKGPQRTVDEVEVHDGRVRFRHQVRTPGRLDIRVTAPAVHEFVMAGSQTLQIQGYDQDELEVTVAGAGSIHAEGRARRVEMRIAGSGDADLGGVRAEEGEVSIAGSGKATLAPTRRAEVNIAGSGDVILLTDPPNLATRIFGSGRILRRPAEGPKPGETSV